MLGAALQGFGLGASLIIAIGAQNTLLLRHGILRRHVLPLVLIGAISDALLILAGVIGLGGLIATYPAAIEWARWAGAAFLVLYALLAFRRALSPETLSAATDTSKDRRSAMVAMLVMTWANPHVYLDTVVLLGSLSAQFEGSARAAFGAGAICASFVWFFALGFGARLLTPLFKSARVWQVLEFAIATVMVAMAVLLVV